MQRRGRLVQWVEHVERRVLVAVVHKNQVQPRFDKGSKSP